MMSGMTGVALLLALAIGVVSLIAVANLIGMANAGHERSGLFGDDPRRRRLEVEALDALVASDTEESSRARLVATIEQLDRLSFAGVPLVAASPTSEWGWWALRFEDDTELSVQVGDPRTMNRVRSLAAKESIVVSKVHVYPDSAVVELSSPRHRPLRVALRS